MNTHQPRRRSVHEVGLLKNRLSAKLRFGGVRRNKYQAVGEPAPFAVHTLMRDFAYLTRRAMFLASDDDSQEGSIT